MSSDQHAELVQAVRDARAWLEWAAETGAEGVPVHDRRAQAELSQDGHPDEPTRVGELASAPAVQAAPLEEQRDVRARLAQIEQEVRSCTRCPLHRGRCHTVFARGDPETALVLVGEGPGADEDRQGVPFVGPAGQLLDRMVGAMGYGRDEVYLCNIVKCRPPNNRKPTVEEMRACMPFLQEQLELVNPDVLLALGATAVQALLGWWDAGPQGPGITRLRGHWKLYDGRIPLMPTFHPAYLLRSPQEKRHVWQDLQLVMRRLGKEPPAKRGRSG